MSFDVLTLDFAGAMVAMLGGVFLLIYWWKERAAWAALWWAGGSCGLGIGICMLTFRAELPPVISEVVGPFVLDISAALTWVATRIFRRSSVNPYPILAGVGVWLALLAVAGASDHIQLAATIGLAGSACLYTAGAVEFYVGRSESVRGRPPMIFFLGLFAISLALTTIQVWYFDLFLPMLSLGVLGIIHFSGIVYAVGGAISLVTMLKDRSETKHKAAALVDPLTGLPNRRAFMERAQRVLDRGAQDQAQISLLAFDLDQFKRINDTFGHATGDQVLRIFADALSWTTRPADVVGRLGGEEFALVLPGCDTEAAAAIAERIRRVFQDNARFINGMSVGATVSIGVATNARNACSLSDILETADGALYRAKEQGRNRVVLADGGGDDRGPNNVVRIA